MTDQQNSVLSEESVGIRHAMADFFRTEAVKSTTIESHGARLLVTKGRRFGNEPATADVVVEYPVVPTRLEDDADTWLR
ncbi:MAG: hypothetical protein V4813_13080 [Gemmatimonadota bacterium]